MTEDLRTSAFAQPAFRRRVRRSYKIRRTREKDDFLTDPRLLLPDAIPDWNVTASKRGSLSSIEVWKCSAADKQGLSPILPTYGHLRLASNSIIRLLCSRWRRRRSARCLRPIQRPRALPAPARISGALVRRNPRLSVQGHSGPALLPSLATSRRRHSSIGPKGHRKR